MKAHFSLMGLLIFLLNPQPSTAQEIEFDLRNYKTTNYERSSLDLNFDLSQRVTSDKQMLDPVLWTDEEFKSDFSTRASIGYNELLLNRKRNISKGLSASTYILNRRIQEDQFRVSPDYILNKNSFYSFNGSAYRDAEHFYSEDLNQFWKYRVQLDINTNSSYVINEHDTVKNEDSVFRSLNPLRISGQLGHGFGRIEYVEDAIEAIYILDELKQKGIVDEDVTEEQIRSFADKITQLKKRRYFDNRIYQQVVMEEMIQFLNEKKLISSESIGLYNTVNDYHFLAGINTRPSGQKLSYGLTSNLVVSNSKDRLQESSSLSLGTTVGLKVSYENYIPVDIHWQRNFSTTLNFDRSSAISRSNSDDFGEPYINPYDFSSRTSYLIGYYPSTRTTITSSVYAILNLNKLLKFEKLNTRPTVETGLNFSGNYYFSERLRLNATLNLLFTKDTEPDVPSNVFSNRDHNYFNQSLEISFNYYIF